MGETGDAAGIGPRRARAGALWLGALLAALAVAQPAFGREPIVLLVSMDGVRHDYLERDPLPSFTRMATEGARAERLVVPFPSITFPSHVTLATGAAVDRHGIVANSFRDRDGRRFHYSNDASWILAEPLWVTAERQGVRTATFFWVGSETDWHGLAATHRMTPFDEAVTEDAKVDQIFAWLDLPEPQRPRLVMSWWHGADKEGHRHGPDSDEVRAAMRQQDAALGRLLAGLDARGLWSDTTLLVVSDHGMTAIGETVDLEAALAAQGISARVISGGPLAHVWLDDAVQRDAALRTLGALPGVRAFASDALPDTLHYGPASRLGDVVALADPPRVFASESTTLGVANAVMHLLGWRQGAHGYDPTLPEMGGILLALGRGVSPGTRFGVARALDVAPTLARLLAIAPPRDAEGVPIAGLGAVPGGAASAAVGAEAAR